MSFQFEASHLRKIAQYPHLYGHIIGKTKLTDMHSQWASYCWRKKGHAAFQAHRGSYKTTIITEVGIPWWLLFNPGDRIALIRKTFRDASRTLSAIRKQFELDEVKMLFQSAHGIPPIFQTKQMGSVTFNFKDTITKEGSIDAYGVGSAITGMHYDVVVLDDIVGFDDRYSKAEREKTKAYLMEIQTNIIDRGKKIIHVGTPWHRDDAWTLTPPDFKRNWKQTGLIHDFEMEELKRKTTPSLFSANYDLEHISDESKLFPEFRYIGVWNFAMRGAVAHLDAKFSGNHTAALTIMALNPNGTIHWMGWVFTENVKHKIGWVLDKLAQYNCHQIYIETNPDKGYTADALYSEAVGRGQRLTVKRYAETMNKHVKISSYLLDFWIDLIAEPNMCPNYKAQVLDYQEGQEPDDAPDSAASLLREHFKKRMNMSLWKD